MKIFKKNPDRKKFRDLKAWQKLLIICGIIILVLCLAVTILINSVLNKINRDVGIEPIDPSEEYFETDDNENGYDIVDPESIQWPETEEVTPDADITNILLIGQDRREGESRARSDSMIIVSINKESKVVSLVSLMRDTYVQIPGYNDNRINAAYAFGGMELLDETIYLNFGIEIDANVEVDFNAFTSIIDTVGGVDINISAAEANRLRGFCSRNGYPAPKEGIMHMDGELALRYARIRDLAGSDFARTERQRKVVASIINKARSSDLETILGIANELLTKVTTDLTNTEMVGYDVEFFPMLSDCSIDMYRVPQNGDYYDASIRGMSVLVPDITACREYLYDIIYG